MHYTIKQAADLLGLSPSTLRIQANRGKLGAFKISTLWFVPAEEVERYRRENKRAHDGA